MVASPDCDQHTVTSSLQDIIPSIQLERSHGKEISYTVPLDDVASFSSRALAFLVILLLSVILWTWKIADLVGRL